MHGGKPQEAKVWSREWRGLSRSPSDGGLGAEVRRGGLRSWGWGGSDEAGGSSKSRSFHVLLLSQLDAASPGDLGGEDSAFPGVEGASPWAPTNSLQALRLRWQATLTLQCLCPVSGLRLQLETANTPTTGWCPRPSSDASACPAR